MLWARHLLRRSTHIRQRTLLNFFRLSSTQSVSLRPYQENCLQTCLETLNSGVTRIGVSLPTGSGKTVVFVSLLSRISAPIENPKATRALIIVNSIELARQAAAQAERLFPEWSVEIEQGVKHKALGLADVTVATYQTLLQGDRLLKFDPRNLKAIIIDEAHHAAAPSYRRILSHFDSEIKHPEADFKPPVVPPHKIPIIGFSATFSRHDGLALGSVFSEIVFHRDFLEMIKEQWLCSVRFTSVKANVDLSNVVVNSRTGDFNATSLAQVINTPSINELIVRAWLDRAQERKSTLVFCVDVAHVRALTEVFMNFGIDARFLYAGTPLAERKALIQDFREQKFPVLVNCAILTEGADIPNIDCVVIARPTRSQNVFAQMVGRGMRLCPNTGKTDCHIIDFVESETRVDGIVSTPTLFGLDPRDVDIDNETLESLQKRAAEKESTTEKVVASEQADVPDPVSVRYVDYDDPETLARDAFGSTHLTRISRNAWVSIGHDIYVLECLGKGFVRVEPMKNPEGEKQYRAAFTPAGMDRQTTTALKVPPMFLRSREILKANHLSEAIRGSESYVTKKVVFGPMVFGLLRSARWRQTPATPAQQAFVSKRLNKNGDLVKEAKITKMTKGDAATIIIRLKHGAQARFAKDVQQAKKAHIAQTKEMQRRARGSVRVGPLEDVIRPQAL